MESLFIKHLPYLSAVTIDNSDEEDVDDILGDQLRDDALKKRGRLQKTVAAKVSRFDDKDDIAERMSRYKITRRPRLKLIKN